MAAVRRRAVALDFERKAFYTPAEVAAILQVSTQTVRDWIHHGRLYGIRLSERIYRIPLGALLLRLGEAPRVTRKVHPYRTSGNAADLRRLVREHRPPTRRKTALTEAAQGR
ncbi:MAG: helix-turn-helix domain-containing protein [Candidatus Limnocylindria bacterium]